MNIHLPAILMFTRGTRFWHTAIWLYSWEELMTWEIRKSVYAKGLLMSEGGSWNVMNLPGRLAVGNHLWVGDRLPVLPRGKNAKHIYIYLNI
jgi:hypothetical protein